MAVTNPALIYLTVKSVQRDYLPMFTLKTVRNIIKRNMHPSVIGRKMVVRKLEVEDYMSSIQSSESH